jgi:hypothetical protein
MTVHSTAVRPAVITKDGLLEHKRKNRYHRELIPTFAWDDGKTRTALSKHILQVPSYGIWSLPSREMAAFVVVALED